MTDPLDTLAPPLRRARVQDADALARLMDLAGSGVPRHLWAEMTAPGEDVAAVGAARQAQKIAEGTADMVVVDEGAGPIAGLTAYLVPEEPEPLDELPPVVRPVQELENLVPATYCVNMLAVLPDHEGRGWGGRLIDLAGEVAAARGITGLSIVVADMNLRARRLYAAKGFEELARRPVVRDGWQGQAEEWIVLTRGAGRIGDAAQTGDGGTG